MIDEKTLREGDTVDFMIRRAVGFFRGTVVKENGHYRCPELKVTHSRPTMSDEWAPNQEWDQFTLKDGDYILI
jgi:hypothetical protein